MANKKIVFKDGTVFEGVNFGYDKEVVGQIEYNTSMFGYQQIAGDPTNKDKIVVLTYPIIGNFGVNDEDSEYKKATVKAMICHEYNDEPSNFRFTGTYHEYLEDSKVPLISNVDTRAIITKINKEGNQVVCIANQDRPLEECLSMIEEYQTNENPIAEVSFKKKAVLRSIGAKTNLVCLDLGTKSGLISKFNELKCNVTVVPYNTSAETILSLNANGVLISDGPDTEESLEVVLDTVKDLIGKTPIFATGLGALVVALASGCDVYKLKHGHHGANHPVKKLSTGKIEITSQNRNFAVCSESLEGTSLVMTHENVLDHTLEGFMDKENKIVGVLYRPWDQTCDYSQYLFDEFYKSVKGVK